jgi:hypothetical protein
MSNTIQGLGVQNVPISIKKRTEASSKFNITDKVEISKKNKQNSSYCNNILLDTMNGATLGFAIPVYSVASIAQKIGLLNSFGSGSILKSVLGGSIVAASIPFGLASGLAGALYGFGYGILTGKDFRK